jgi:D-alanine-D-alanine ligase
MHIILIKAFNKKPWRSPETYRRIESALNAEFEKVSVVIAENGTQVKSELMKYSGKSSLFVFNIAEFTDGTDAAFIPHILEELDLPHLGSSCETILNGLNKAKAKELAMETGVPTPDFFLVNKFSRGWSKQAEEIGYPVIIKPNFGGGHIGIEDDSIVYNNKQFIETLKKYLQNFNEPMLVEKYITEENMREFSVGIIGNETRIILPLEIDYNNMQVQTKILSGTTAQKDLEKVKLLRGEERLEAKICNMAALTYDALKGSDYCRVDLRMNNTGLYLLEINIMPGLGPLSFLPFAAKEIMGLDYPQLISLLTKESMKKFGI